MKKLRLILSILFGKTPTETPLISLEQALKALED